MSTAVKFLQTICKSTDDIKELPNNQFFFLSKLQINKSCKYIVPNKW